MRIWPRTLLGRNIVLLIGLVLASQVCALAIFMIFIQRPRIDDAASLVASEIKLVNRLLAKLPPAERQKELAEMNGLPDAAVPLSQVPATFPNIYLLRRFFRRLARDLPPGVELRWEGQHAHRVWVQLNVDSKDYWINLPVSPAIEHFVPWSMVYLLFSVTAFPIFGAYLIHRRTEGPLRRLARAAARIEKGDWPDAVPVEGPLELATVAEAFNRMMAALVEMETTRAEMLAGISHDIRTPLTKLRMAISAPEAFDAPTESAERFVGEIDVIVQQFIDFARGSGSEAPVLGDLNGLVEQLAGDYAGLGHPFELVLEPLPLIAYRPIGIQRVVMNLMQNAVAYGRVGLAVRTRAEAGFAVLSVEDRGPGVAEAVLSQMKQPFRRGSNSDQKAGTGLGLAIADRIARQHGGSLELSLGEGGGLVCTLHLPLA